MLDIKITDTSFDFLKYGSLSYFLSFFFILEIILPIFNLTSKTNTVFDTNYTWINWFAELEGFSNVQAIGQLLYTYYFLFFLIAGMVLFVSIVGALMLTVNLNKSLFKQV